MSPAASTPQIARVARAPDPITLAEHRFYLAKTLPAASRQSLATLILDAMGLVLTRCTKAATHVVCPRSGALDAGERGAVRALEDERNVRIVDDRWLPDSLRAGRLLPIDAYAIVDGRGLCAPAAAARPRPVSGKPTVAPSESQPGSNVTLRPFRRANSSFGTASSRGSATADNFPGGTPSGVPFGVQDFFDTLVFDVHGHAVSSSPVSGVSRGETLETTAPAKRRRLASKQREPCGPQLDLVPAITQTQPPRKGGIFAGVGFRAIGFTREESATIQQVVEQHGGTWGVASQPAFAQKRFLVVPVDKEVHTAAGGEPLVTECWIEACLDAQALLAPELRLVYRPFMRPPAPALRRSGLNFGITGFEDIHRMHVRRLVEALGMRFTERFTIKQTHLICAPGAALAASSKYAKALEWGTPAVTLEFVEACALAGAIVDDGPFRVGARASAVEPAVENPREKPQEKPRENPKDSAVSVDALVRRAVAAAVRPQVARVASPELSLASQPLPASANDAEDGDCDALRPARPPAVAYDDADERHAFERLVTG